MTRQAHTEKSSNTFLKYKKYSQVSDGTKIVAIWNATKQNYFIK